jgi:hypothetical protein
MECDGDLYDVGHRTEQKAVCYSLVTRCEQEEEGMEEGRRSRRRRRERRKKRMKTSFAMRG